MKNYDKKSRSPKQYLEIPYLLSCTSKNNCSKYIERFNVLWSSFSALIKKRENKFMHVLICVSLISSSKHSLVFYLEYFYKTLESEILRSRNAICNSNAIYHEFNDFHWNFQQWKRDYCWHEKVICEIAQKFHIFAKLQWLWCWFNRLCKMHGLTWWYTSGISPLWNILNEDGNIYLFPKYFSPSLQTNFL